MRLKLTFTQKQGKPLILPLHYNACLQGMLYRSLSKHAAVVLHDVGYPLNNRKYKLFTFSRILQNGKPIIKSNKRFLMFPSSFSFYLSSATDMLSHELLSMSIKPTPLQINGQEITLKELKVISDPCFSSSMLIRMLSPITVYSTFYTSSKMKRSHYYHPWSHDFSYFLKQNLLHKYAVIHQCEVPTADDMPFSISPVKVNRERNFSVILYKNNPIESWMGIYKIQGSPSLIKISHHTGLGAKNSMGFGMWDVFSS